jgi:hypothetical protein
MKVDFNNKLLQKENTNSESTSQDLFPLFRECVTKKTRHKYSSHKPKHKTILILCHFTSVTFNLENYGGKTGSTGKIIYETMV